MRLAAAAAIVIAMLTVAPSGARTGSGALSAPALVPPLVLREVAAAPPKPPHRGLPLGRPHCLRDSPGGRCTYWCQELINAAPSCGRNKLQGTLRFVRGR